MGELENVLLKHVMTSNLTTQRKTVHIIRNDTFVSNYTVDDN